MTVLVPLMGSTDEEIGAFVCDAIQRVFKSDKLGDVSYEIVKTLANELKVSTQLTIHSIILFSCFNFTMVAVTVGPTAICTTTTTS